MKITDLTFRERQVLRLLAEGFTSQNIAARLGISVRTVETHRGRIHKKVGGGNLMKVLREFYEFVEKVDEGERARTGASLT
jgi:DNA-binding CsgD family transcriptional regulator